ncbi:MAG TPA: class III extradiol ring-cleavage dioxygenase [Crinalium sp.]|jgi:4,5-DOPA dioxygenase extradiol
MPHAVFPAIFVSHGSPDLPLQPNAVTDFLKQLGHSLEKPTAILVVSAHWGTNRPTVSTAPEPRTVHDFSGFPAALYEITYAAPGAPALASRVKELLIQAGVPVDVHPQRGLDHGAWVPLLLMYPNANIPVTQLSIQPNADPAHHLAIGRALEPLRHEGVLILASGSATHNLWELGRYANQATPPDWVQQFSDWLDDAIAHNKTDDLLNYRQIAPYAERNHPTDEHLLPLFVAMGAGGEMGQGRSLHNSYTFGILSMASYAFS